MSSVTLMQRARSMMCAGGAAAAMALSPLAASSAEAGVTFDGAANGDAYVINASGANFFESSVDSSQVSPTQVKLFGEATATGVFDPGNGGIGFDWDGNFADGSAVAPGDSFVLPYEFSISVNGGTISSWTLDFQVASDDEPRFGSTFGSGTGTFTGTVSQDQPFSLASGLFDGYDVELNVDWTGFTSGDTITVTVPENSIDFVFVPEPATAALLCLGGLTLVARRRR